MKKHSLVSVLIVNWNGYDFTIRTIKSIQESSYKNYEIIVVDNDSKDGSSDKLSLIKGIKLVKSNKNLGFSGGNNLALQYSKGDFIFVVGHDILMDKDCIAKLVNAALKENNLGIISPIVYEMDEPKKIQQIGGKIDPFGFSYPLIYTYTEDNLDQEKIMYLPGCSLFIPRKVIEKIGLFDDSFFTFSEDIDLGWRMQIAGFNLKIVKDAKLWHKGSAGMTEPEEQWKYGSLLKRYLSERNNLMTILKNYQLYSLVCVLPFYLLSNLGEMSLFLAFGNFKVANVYLRSWIWNLGNISRIIKKRRFIKKIRKRTDIELYKKFYFGSGKLYIISKVGMPSIR